MDYNGRIEDIVKRLEANYVVKNFLKTSFNKGSPLSFGKKEVRFYLPAVRKREKALKKIYRNLTGVGYNRRGDLIRRIDRIREKYSD